MGGKIWSKEEENIFWTELMPHSPKRLGADYRNNKEKGWDWVASEMAKRMSVRRRQYTGLSVYEHYFLNAYQSKFSPNVGKLCIPYWRYEQSLKKKQTKKAMEKKRLEEEQVVKARLCQYPTPRPYLDSSLPQPYRRSSLSQPVGFAASSAIPRLVLHGAPHPQYSCNRFAANHDRLESTEVEENGLSVHQPAAHCANAMAPWSPGYQQ
ncbi:hypothetical protein C8A03DRAFT_29517 [Achaetomium macrosporum]|uniref:Uncharacterized protein n=1 Tax=Achaetomium macrosporum TaxID=79813 RepID=A0AAN7CHM8_9PEZI|nr:hypothetical protein C8A03DRAFT_29517 [Achaetomium macrosporum]